MEIIVKRKLVDFKASDIWRIEILSKKDNFNFVSFYSPKTPIGDCVENHLKLFKKRLS